MKRYLKLFFLYLYINIKELKSYGIDFYLGSIAMFLKNISNLFLIFFIYNIVNVINGWNINEMIYLYSIVTISFSIWRCFFINTLNISYYIINGKLDILLIKPLNPLFLIFMEGFDEDAWGDLAVGIIIYFYISFKLNLPILNIILVFIIALLGGLVFSGISVIGSLFSIIFLGSSNFSDLPYIIYEFSKYPINIFNPVISILFKTIIPVAWIGYIPAYINLKDGNQNLIIVFLISVFITILYFIIVVLIWNNVLKKYSSSGT
ncbi:ABC transporter permease [Streptobacillus moniliformis]|uniref:ABC-2 type transport system permease protein n=1 Tax=Streptobacillus moniliformis (strain ATCC 14647 / DSM 12112 / NCTC 10651 / 9901) TaxID=519441 RepID=D1AYW2_STRM9|nr:ABC-2 family transporter protein [Streptobacillus moniliformis]ACZ01936.1 protein of unknown function DUF990 [Streptobacillus moniliformis DSM 12112]SQA14938.1 ABC-type uncharacterized transport system, permease component [Streptobacillus moniliformis]SQA14967.1 ABC-type uncharacterized transport system, permease component [Streptobacillus moniliformis]